jgi:hypothetical protein
MESVDFQMSRKSSLTPRPIKSRSSTIGRASVLTFLTRAKYCPSSSSDEGRTQPLKNSLRWTRLRFNIRRHADTPASQQMPVEHISECRYRSRRQ